MRYSSDLREIADGIYHYNDGMMTRDDYLSLYGTASDVESVEEENTTLRQQLADVTESYGRLEERCAKLRELVRILKNCADEHGDCDTCPINDGTGVLNPWLGCDSLRDRMRELGVEVTT